MAPLALAATMAAMADALVAAGVVDVAWPHPTKAVDVGEAVPGVAGDIRLGMTFGHGASRTDSCTIPWVVIAGLEDDPDAWQRASDLLAAGPGSVDAALGGDLGGLVSSVTVADPTIVLVPIDGGIVYLGVRFPCAVVS